MRRGVGDRQMRLRPFRYADLDAVTPRDDFAREMAALSPYRRLRLVNSFAFTLERGADLAPRTILACGGVRGRRDGTWSMWCYAADLDARGWSMVSHGAEGLCRLALDTLEGRAVEMMCDTAHEGAAAFARRLGFRADAEPPFERAGAVYQVYVRERR
ncbi:MAG TPA: hypothetical protein VEA44_16200 [Caulobacter sp.]|nr:hypothetical protein [Caulobacter sp.]